VSENDVTAKVAVPKTTAGVELTGVKPAPLMVNCVTPESTVVFVTPILLAERLRDDKSANPRTSKVFFIFLLGLVNLADFTTAVSLTQD
jgi:hypothetical protein